MKIRNLKRNLFFAAAIATASIPLWLKAPTQVVLSHTEIKETLVATTVDGGERSTLFHKKDLGTLEQMTQEVHSLLEAQAKESSRKNLLLYYASTVTTIGLILAGLMSHESQKAY